MLGVDWCGTYKCIAGNFAQDVSPIPLVAVENLAAQVVKCFYLNICAYMYAQLSLENCAVGSRPMRKFALLSVHSVKDGVIEVELVKACQHPVSSLESPGQTNHKYLREIAGSCDLHLWVM